MRKHPILTALLVLAVARFFIATVTPVFDTSEARYAAISANMARTGDFLVPRFTYDDVYQSFDGKPPLLFQTAGAACKVLGCREIAVRLPGLLATLALLGLLWYTVKTLSDRRRALLAVGICSTSVAVYALSGFCMTDALLVPCIAGAYLSYALLLRTGQRNWSLGIFLSLAFGMLVKGPVAVALFVGPLVIDACVNHHWRKILSFRWFSGTLIFLGIAAPWFILMERQTPGFLRYFFINENLLRFLVKDYGDKYGAGREFFRGMALVWALVVTLPWTPALLFGDRTKRDVFFWGIVGITGFWCLTSRIPLTYVMPIVPLFAAWVALHAKDAKLPLLEKAIPWTAFLAVAILSTSLAVGMTTTKRLRGADAPYRHNRYSYEFYHGTPDFAQFPQLNGKGSAQ